MVISGAVRLHEYAQGGIIRMALNENEAGTRNRCGNSPDGADQSRMGVGDDAGTPCKIAELFKIDLPEPAVERPRQAGRIDDGQQSGLLRGASRGRLDQAALKAPLRPGKLSD